MSFEFYNKEVVSTYLPKVSNSTQFGIKAFAVVYFQFSYKWQKTP